MLLLPGSDVRAVTVALDARRRGSFSIAAAHVDDVGADIDDNDLVSCA